MGTIAGQQLLTAWDSSCALPEQEAVLSLLALAWPERSMGELARLPLGERNALLLELHDAMFGSRMDGFAICPDCGAELELTADPRALARGLRSEPADASEEIAGYSMRPLNSLDLLASGNATSEEEARRILLARSLGLEEHELERLGESAASLAERFEDVFARMNAGAEIRVRLECAACRNRSVLDLDIARYLLREVAAAGRRLMGEIHELASAHGWSEAAIAGMSPARRAVYLEMLSV
jgi:hypothetical protein